MYFFHGINAFTETPSLGGYFSRAKTVNQGAEVCGSSRPIGPIGVVVYGDCTAVFDRDVWSAVDNAGRRYIETASSYRCFDPSRGARAVYNWLRKHTHGADHDEVWIKGRVSHVWVKPWADDRTKRVAAALARAYGCRLLTVEGRDRVWNAIPDEVNDLIAQDELEQLENQYGEAA